MRLMKKQVKEASTEVLNWRYHRLLEKGKELEAHEFSMAEAREILWVEEELHQRVILAVGHDFYPPEVGAKPTMADLRARLSPFKKSIPAPRATEIIHPCSAGVTKKVEAEIKTEGKFRFKITVKSSIGSVVATKNVKVDSKSDAHVAAQKLIDLLGIKKASYKIS